MLEKNLKAVAGEKIKDQRLKNLKLRLFNIEKIIFLAKNIKIYLIKNLWEQEQFIYEYF